MKKVYPKQVSNFTGRVFKAAKINNHCGGGEWNTIGPPKKPTNEYIQTLWRAYPIKNRHLVTKCNFTVEKVNCNSYNHRLPKVYIYIWCFQFGY